MCPISEYDGAMDSKFVFQVVEFCGVVMSLHFFVYTDAGRSAQLLCSRYWCGGLGFGFQVGQIEHSVGNGSPPLRRFFGAVLPRR